MCFHCFDILIDELNKQNRLNIDGSAGGKGSPDFLQSLPNETVLCPLFVTWEKRKGQHQNRLSKHISYDHNNSKIDQFELRGCIGTLSPKPLATSIGEYALISALRDQRFGPVIISELPQLRVAVSLLVQYEECEHCYDWSIGVHGIMIRWSGDNSTYTEYSATYLVRTDQ